MSIQIPCPQCGRELKLPDRSLLGRKGKCPKCGHTFILEEPAAVTLELAQPEKAAVPRDSGTAPVFAAAQPPSSPVEPVATLGAFVPPELAALDQVVKPKGAAARLKELQQKNARRRNVGLAVGAVIALSVGLFAWLAPKFAGQRAATVDPKTPSVESATAANDTVADSGSGYEEGLDPRETEYAQMGSPTHGQPIELQYIPYGTEVVINVHPARLWRTASLGEEIRYCLPPVAKLIETTLSDLFQRKPEEVEELLICLIPGPRGTQPDVAAVARLVDEQKRSQLVEQFGQRVDTYGHPIYVNGERAYMIIDPKTVVVGPKPQAEEMVRAISERPPNEQLDPLLPLTDRDRDVTLVLTPLTIGLQDAWFPDNVRPLLKNALSWLGDETEAISWSFNLTDELFYSELVLRRKNSPAKRYPQEMRRKLEELAGYLMPFIQMMNPKEQGKRMVIGRLPAMLEVFSLATIVDQGPRHIRFVTPLPDRAAANLVLGSLLAWDESTRTDFTKAKPTTTDDVSLPATVAERLKMKLDIDFRAMPLNEAFAFVANEIKTPIDIDGDGLKLGGFTKNIKQTFVMNGARAQDVILRMFEECKGIQTDPAKNLVLIVDEGKKSILLTTTAAATNRGLTPYVFPK